MEDLETNQARMVAALETLEAKIAALKAGDGVRAENQALAGQLAQTKARLAALQEASVETLKDLDLALGQLNDVSQSRGGGAHG